MKAVYKITNNITGNFYIGSTNNYKSRVTTHVNYLEKGTSPNTILQRAWKKYGKGVFSFSILEEVEDEKDLIAREQYYLDLYNPKYNVRTIAESNRGIKRSSQTVDNMRKASPNKKAITQYDLEGNFIREWESIAEANRFFSIDRGGGVGACCKGKLFSCKGYRFSYKGSALIFNSKAKDAQQKEIELKSRQVYSTYQIQYLDNEPFVVNNLKEFCKSTDISYAVAISASLRGHRIKGYKITCLKNNRKYVNWGEDKDFKKLFKKHTYAELGRKFNCNVNSVKTHARKLGLLP